MWKLTTSPPRALFHSVHSTPWTSFEPLSSVATSLSHSSLSFFSRTREGSRLSASIAFLGVVGLSSGILLCSPIPHSALLVSYSLLHSSSLLFPACLSPPTSHRVLCRIGRDCCNAGSMERADVGASRFHCRSLGPGC